MLGPLTKFFLLTSWRRSFATYRQTNRQTDGHGDSMTDLAQRAESVKRERKKLKDKEKEQEKEQAGTRAWARARTRTRVIKKERKKENHRERKKLNKEKEKDKRAITQARLMQEKSCKTTFVTSGRCWEQRAEVVTNWHPGSLQFMLNGGKAGGACTTGGACTDRLTPGELCLKLPQLLQQTCQPSGLSVVVAQVLQLLPLWSWNIFLYKIKFS